MRKGHYASVEYGMVSAKKWRVLGEALLGT